VLPSRPWRICCPGPHCVAVESIDGRDVCRVDGAPSDAPVFIGSTGGARTADFHLCVGNATRRLLTDEVLDDRARRWA
jgi:hypothetical protein